jgi:hypothetical protein
MRRAWFNCLLKINGKKEEKEIQMDTKLRKCYK